MYNHRVKYFSASPKANENPSAIRANKKLWHFTGSPHGNKPDRPKKWGVISSAKWDTALESWNMSKRLGEILLNTASWHLLLSAPTRKRLALLTCNFVIRTWTISVGLVVPLMKKNSSRNGVTEELKPVFHKEHSFALLWSCIRAFLPPSAYDEIEKLNGAKLSPLEMVLTELK